MVSVFNIGRKNMIGTLGQTFGNRDVKLFVLNHDLDNYVFNGNILDELTISSKSNDNGLKPKGINYIAKNRLKNSRLANRLNPEDFGYNGSKWQTFDNVRNFGTDN